MLFRSFPETPWLALVVLTFEEGDVVANRPLAEAVTAPTTLPGSWKDADAATVLQVRRSVVQRVFPAADELHLLTHVRQVHLSDTELALGDDDGWMAVIVANRLPQPGTRYRVCLISLEEQLDLLPDSSRIQVESSFDPGTLVFEGSPAVHADLQEPKAWSSAHAPLDAWSGKRGTTRTRSMRKRTPGLALEVAPDVKTVDPILRFPVLASWTFVCAGGGDFQSRMEGLDVGLLGTIPAPKATPDRPVPPRARPLPEVLPTGHVALDGRTRDGQPERVWYRGPFLPAAGTRQRPGTDGRLPLRHVKIGRAHV